MSFASIFMLLDFGLELCFNWTTFGIWFLKLIFKTCYTMSLQVFSRKLAQKDWIWCIGIEFWAWGSNLKIPDFGLTLERGVLRSSVSLVFMQSARARKVALEREMRVSSTLHVFTVRSSERVHVRARTCVSRSSVYQVPVEHDFCASSTFTVACSSLEQRKLRLSEAHLSACPLERRKPRSSETLVFWKF